MLRNNRIKKGAIVLLTCVCPAMCAATPNITVNFYSGTNICASSRLIYITYADVDDDPSTGKWVGGTWYPNETQIELYPTQGSLDINPPDAPGQILFGFVGADCGETGWETKPGKFVMRFTDVTPTEYVWDDPSTWEQGQVINVNVQLSHGDIFNYQVYNGPDDPGNILNPDPTIEVIAYESWGAINEVGRVTGSGEHSLFAIGTGFSELVFQTDFVESRVHYIELSMIPEPATLVLLALGGLGILRLRKT
jgi:hypothetical protein